MQKLNASWVRYALIVETANQQIVRRLFEKGWNQGSFGFLAGRTADVVPMHYNGETLEVTADSLPGLAGMWRTAFADLAFEIRHLIGDGDVVAVSLVFRGTHRGDWWGLAASGKSVEVEETMFFRFEDGTLVEMWELFDEQTLKRQIGEPVED